MSNLRPKFEVHRQNVDTQINLSESIKKVPISFKVEKQKKNTTLVDGVLSANNSVDININEKIKGNKNSIYDFNNINIDKGK